jgi:hypothetical protein
MTAHLKKQRHARASWGLAYLLWFKIKTKY